MTINTIPTAGFWATIAGLLNGNFFSLSQQYGHETVSDAATAGTPIPLVVANTFYKLTNDGLGAQTDSSARVSGHGPMWNPITSQLDFSSLKINDVVDFRIDLLVNLSGPNRELTCRMDYGIGAFVPLTPVFSLTPDSRGYNGSGLKPVEIDATVTMGSQEIIDNPAEILFATDGTGSTVIVQGFLLETKVR